MIVLVISCFQYQYWLAEVFLNVHRPSGKHVRAMNTPLNPTFIRQNWGMEGYTYFLIFAPKHRLWVLVRTASARRF